MFTKSEKLGINILEVAVKNNERYQELTQDMPSKTLRDLVPGISEQDISDDTGVNSIEVDEITNPQAKVGHMFTLQNLNHLFNVKLRRSDVRLRLDENDKATRVLEQKVEELEKWRIDIEERIANRSKEVDEQFDHK